MDERRTAPEWMPYVDGVVRRFADASAEDQQEACEVVKDKWGSVAAAKTRELLQRHSIGIDRARLTDLSARLARVKANPLFILPKSGIITPSTADRVGPSASDDLAWVREDRQRREAMLVTAKRSTMETPLRIGKPALGEPGCEPDPRPNGEIAASPSGPRDILLLKPPKPETELPLVRFSTETPKTEKGPALLTQTSPYDTAKEYVRRHCWREGSLATYFWQDQFWEWNGRYYGVLATETIRDRVYAFLDGSQKLVGADGWAKFKPTPKLVNDVLDGLRSGLSLATHCQPPIWFDTGKEATDVLVFRDGLVNVLTGERLALTPKLWVHSAVDYDYDPQAKCPLWERFLEEIFPGDQESQDYIEEQLGYGMTEETKFEKAALWIGKARSGKGTIAHVQRKLVGEGSYVGLSLNNWTAGEKSRECLIGKRVGVFPDVRVKQGKHYGASYDAGGVSPTSQELLLNITGRDTLTIGRIYQKAWHGQLRLKIIMISNDVPNFNDPILVSRFIKVKFAQNFFGREDVDLRNKLERELSGIAVRCMAAYQRLIARGKFIQPKSGLELERNVLVNSDPWTAFVNDTFVIDTNGKVKCSLAKLKFDDWCRERGRFDMLSNAPTASLLKQRLKNIAGLENLRTYRAHGDQREYLGLRLKTKDEIWGETD